jgi:serine/threonine-protein kinase
MAAGRINPDDPNEDAMSIATADGLVDAIDELRLLDSEQLARLRPLCRRFAKPVDLARRLIQQGLLTAYQVNQLLSGKGKSLILGPYALLERIGAGGMGEVFKARHLRLHRVAAVKVILGKRSDNPDAVRRFQREVLASAALSHPNIVQVFDAGNEDDSQYLAMEFIDGIDLAHLLRQCAPLPIDLICDFMRQTCEGLHHAHEVGLIHRDIKPQNLLVAPRGGMKNATPLSAAKFSQATLKILDMGVTRFQGEQHEVSDTSLTKTGAVVGTIDYLAPEQARNAHLIDRRADLYSLGCTMYQLLTGRVPFLGTSAVDKLLCHQTDQPAPLRSLRADIPLALEQLVLRLMAKKPEDRFQTALEVHAALSRPLSGVEIPVPSGRMPQERDVVAFAGLEATRVLDSHEVSPPDFSSTEPPIASKDSPKARKEPRRVGKTFIPLWVFVAAGGLSLFCCSGLLLLLAFNSTSTPAKSDAKAPSIVTTVRYPGLETYITPDAAGVLQIQPKVIDSARILIRQDGSHPSIVNDPDTEELFNLLKMKPAEEIRWMRASYALQPAHFLVISRADRKLGKLERPGLTRVEAPADLPPVYRFVAKSHRTFFLSAAEDYLVVADDVKRISNAFLFSRDKKDVVVHSPALAKALGAIDTKQSIWLAVLKKGLPDPNLAVDKNDQELLKQIFASTQVFSGGTHLSHKLNASFRIETNSPAEVQKLQKAIEGRINFAKIAVGAAKLFNKKPPREQWMVLLAVSQAHIEDDDSTLILRTEIEEETVTD